jgi:hypothetical protein
MNLKRLALSFTLMCALSGAALAGESPIGPCPSGEPPTQPCTSQPETNNDSINPGEAPTFPASVTADLIDLTESLLLALQLF